MFADTLSVTVNGSAKTLTRVAFGNREGLFEDRANGIRARIFHILGKRDRRTTRFDFTKTAADPLLDGVSRQYSMSGYFVIDAPKVGFSDTEISQNVQGIVDWLDVPANLSKVVNGES